MQVVLDVVVGQISDRVSVTGIKGSWYVVFVEEEEEEISQSEGDSLGSIYFGEKLSRLSSIGSSDKAKCTESAKR